MESKLFIQKIACKITKGMDKTITLSNFLVVSKNTCLLENSFG